MFFKNSKHHIAPFLRRSGGIYLICIVVLVIFIGMLTTAKPAYRFSSQAITTWTSDIESSTFLYLIGLENRLFKDAFPEGKSIPKLSNTLFQVATNIKSGDPRSLLAHVIPGYSSFEHRIIVAGEGTDYANLSFESSPPLEEVLKKREAVADEPEEDIKQTENTGLSTGDKKVVFIYNTHNRESFLPHLPGVTDPNSAHHEEVNVTKVSDRIAKTLELNGIGTSRDSTDIMQVLNQKGWKYGKSYDASRPIVEEAIGQNKNIQYIFDIHRDSLRRNKTTKSINGKDYAQLLFVVGAEYASYEKNLALATAMHYEIQESYPGLSKGVITKEGAGTNGVFNQDLSENALLLEIGGVDNNLDELFRSADVVAEVFSKMYWEAEKVDVQIKEE
ncbi:stage II sporulation protein P [Virgibacillus sp. W0430]|uniref:stage II sporulation protein P n=1 Tax=Virgibacillus sp. W0430 TaxID=3391580 RepID=UPI003F469D4B